jgi:tetratricopeptide (TPR) repeat protein
LQVLEALGAQPGQLSKLTEEARLLLKDAYQAPEHLLQLARRLLQEKNNPRAAKAVLEQIVEYCPDWALAHIYLGDAYFALEEDQSALETYLQTLALAHSDLLHWVHLNLGRVLQRSGEHEQAVHEFTQALQLEPNWETPLIMRGHSLLLLGRHAAAIEDLQRAVQLLSFQPPPSRVDGLRTIQELLDQVEVMAPQIIGLRSEVADLLSQP